MIDLHAHILPGLDDGPATWEEALEMARMAEADGIRIMVATPHLFRHRVVDLQQLNAKDVILGKIEEFREKLAAAAIRLEIRPGCDFPLSYDALQLLDQGLVLTINDAHTYLLLELPDTSLPPATEDICFRLQSQGITPIITHPERQVIIQEMPGKLGRLLDLGCLAQLTAGSLTGVFGRQVNRFARKLVKKGYIHVMATDAHSARGRPPVLGQALRELAGLVGEDQARAMVTTIPAKIIQGEPVR